MLRISFSLDSASYQRALDDIHDSSTSSFVLFYSVVVGFCALLRCLVLNRIRDCPLRPRLLEAITCGEQYACWLGHLRVAAVYGTDVALATLAAASVYRWMTQCPGTTANPLSYMLAFVVGQCCMTVEEMCARIGIQVGCALLSHTAASIIWHQSMAERHPATVVAALHCGHPDTAVDAAITAVAQFVSVLVLAVFTLRCGSVVVDLCEMIGQILINALVVAAGYNDTVCHYVAVYLNPLVAMSQLVTCLNREVIAHLVIYWLISISAVLMVGGSSSCGCRNTSGCSLDRPKQRRSDVDNTTKSQQRHRSASRNREQNGERSGQTAAKSSSQRTHECIDEEKAQQPQQQQQQPVNEEKTKKKSHHQHSRQDKETGQKQHDKSRKNDNKHNQRSRSSANSQLHDEDVRQNDNEAVVCGYETQPGTDCMQWQCRMTKSQVDDATNCSGNATHNNDDDCRIESVVRAFRLSQLSTGGVHFDDQGRQDKVNDNNTAGRTTESSTGGHVRSRTALYEGRRQQHADEDTALVITRSSTRETKQRTTSNTSWLPYCEDRCSEYNDSDEGDEQLKEQA